MGNTKTKIKRIGFAGDYIRRGRERLGYSQRGLAKAFSPELSNQFISNVERGHTPIPPRLISYLVDLLELDADVLFGLIEREFALNLRHQSGIELPLPPLADHKGES